MGHEETGISPKPNRFFAHRNFAARDLQYSIALLLVLALLGGIFLQTASSLLIYYYNVNSLFLGILLVIGYILIVVLLAVYFTHRITGPFKRLEYEMKLILSGELNRRLSVRTKDDIHIRNFIKKTNEFISRLAELRAECDRVNALAAERLKFVEHEFSKEGFDRDKLKAEILSLEKEFRNIRPKRP